MVESEMMEGSEAGREAATTAPSEREPLTVSPERGRPIAQSILFLIVMTLLVGGLYPLVITGIAQIAFPWQANGSLLAEKGRTIGSALIGQYFDEPGSFWGRPSATSPNPYDGSLSLASNLTPAGSVLEKQIEARVEALRAADPGERGPLPADLVTASGSGLDPDISPAAAYYQVDRVAGARGLPPAAVRKLVARHIEGRTLGILGEPRVNVLELNLALDRLQ